MFFVVEKEFVLKLARQSIANYFENKNLLEIEDEQIPDLLRQTLSCFVTLTKKGQLCGCIGHLEATQALYLDIIENAVGAAFRDPRFNPLVESEFLEIKIEISILTPVTPLVFKDAEDLLNKLRPNIDGVIFRRGRKGATYLPQVWEELADKKEFLSSLCLKAGLAKDDWEKSGLEVSVYQVEVIK